MLYLPFFQKIQENWHITSKRQNTAIAKPAIFAKKCLFSPISPLCYSS